MGKENEPHYGEEEGQEPFYGEEEDPDKGKGGTGTTGGKDVPTDDQAEMRPTGSGGSPQPS
jgi:hypothetical protein